MESFSKSLTYFTESPFFRYFILGVILASAVIIGLETYPDIYREHHSLLHALDRIILAIFSIEIILKILARGKRPWDFFRDPWNVFDFMVVAVCFIPAIDAHFVAVLRLARVLRVFRVVSVFPKLQLLVGALLKSIPSMGYVVLLLALIFFIYAVLGTFMFGELDPVHFGNLHMSVITLFKVLTLEGWTDIMNIQFYGTHDPMAEYNARPLSYGAFFYFVSFILIGAMIIMNLFIGVIMNSMQESQKEMDLQAAPGMDAGDRISEIENKLDELKVSLSKLKDSLKS